MIVSRVSATPGFGDDGTGDSNTGFVCCIGCTNCTDWDTTFFK